MAITATFTADWSQFIKGTKEAEEALDRFEKQTEEAGGAITKMSTGAAPKVAGLATSMRQFDSVLGALGINIRPVTGAIEEIGLLAGKSAASLGALGTAGAVLAAAIGGWALGRKIAEALGTDTIIANAVSKLKGWGDAAKEASLNVQDTLALASERSGRSITSLSDALAVNTKWLKDHKEAAQATFDANKKVQEATDAVNVALQNHSAVLATINNATRLAAEHALRHGANQRDVALAYKLSDAQIAAVVDKVRQHAEGVKKVNEQLEENKKKLKEADDLALASYSRQVENLKSIATERMKAYGTGAQIQMLKDLEAAEVALAARVYSQITSEKDRMALIEQITKRRLEIANQIMALEKQQTDRIAQGLLSEVQAHQKRMEMQGLDYNGYVKVDTALSTLDQKLKALAAEEAAGIPTKERVNLLMDEFAAANLEAARATDQVIDKNRVAAKSFEELAAAMRKEAAERRASQPAGLTPNAIAGRNGVAIDMFGRPVVAGGGISQLPVVNISVGGNIIGTEAELARLVGGAMTGNYSKGGNRRPV